MIKKITTSSLIILLTLMLAFTIFTKDRLTSDSERRQLKILPDFTVERLFTGAFMTDFEKYMLDQFAFREFFRSVRASFDLNVLNKNDVNDIFLYDDYLVKLEYPYNEQSIDRFNNYINAIRSEYLGDAHSYLTIIPDKAYYVKDGTYPKIDYDALSLSVSENVEDITYINLFDRLSLDDYYKTDTHWKQENLLKVADLIGTTMDISTDFTTIDYTFHRFNDFYGVYHGQSALNLPPDTLTYLVSDSMMNVTIKNYQYLNDEDLMVYDTSRLDAIDAYDVFLSGASPIIEMTHQNADTEKELIIFRDSFASSFAPLLLEEYSKITLIDTRYVSYKVLDQFVDFNNQDVLFMYSTMVVNNSQMLK